MTDDCDHDNVCLTNSVHEITDEAGEHVGWNLLIALRCPACKTPMRFLGQMNVPPQDNHEAARGPWTSFGQEEIGVMFVAMSDEDAAFKVWGRA